MRLLHATELRFQEFFDANIPDYAILSHRWGDDEVSYQDFLARQDLLAGRGKHGSGYAKILAFCEHVAATPRHSFCREPLEWVWVDTCCIDKSSSAELSEAINSMYNWYAYSTACYAYLTDVIKYDEGWDITMAAFSKSQWFRRGWTLQELLAPPCVFFYDMNWAYIGTRDELATKISKASGIPENLIVAYHNMSTASVNAAEKFAWISTRATSRREDLAYCLMGLFEINMPLLYGEGRKAFRRLQLQILSSSNDESIFLWDLPVDGLTLRRLGGHPLLSGLLARQATDSEAVLYPRSRDFHFWSVPARVPGVSRPPYAVTNQGLELRVPKKLASKPEFYLPLNLRYLEEDGFEGVYAILLMKVETDKEDIWYRYFSDSLPPRLLELPRVKNQACGRSNGLFVAPESWLWSRDQLAEMETEVIYIKLLGNQPII